MCDGKAVRAAGSPAGHQPRGQGWPRQVTRPALKPSCSQAAPEGLSPPDGVCHGPAGADLFGAVPEAARAAGLPLGPG